MGILDSLNPINAIVETVGKVATDLVTTDKERMALDIQAYQAETDRMDGQVEINKLEAQSASLFVSGWRPAVGWIGAAAMAYQFLIYPFMTWGWAAMQAAHYISIGLQPPPQISTDALWVILSGLLGLGTVRTIEKLRGVNRQ